MIINAGYDTSINIKDKFWKVGDRVFILRNSLHEFGTIVKLFRNHNEDETHRRVKVDIDGSELNPHIFDLDKIDFIKCI